jgi:hypothetical protein
MAAATETTIASNLQALGFDDPATLALFSKVSQALGIPIDNTITEFANNQNAILQLLTDKNYGKDQYYENGAKAFQLGDDLLVDPVTGNNYYAVIDPTKQIITQAAFEELINGQNVKNYLKIAKTDPVSGLLVPLDGNELAQFNSYFLTLQIPGVPVTIINNAANILAFLGVMTYYKTYNLNNLQTAFAAALKSFLTTFAFNGEFFNGDLEDYIKANVPGCRNFFISGTTLDGAPFNGSTLLGSGYFNYLPAILANIATYFTYTPY